MPIKINRRFRFFFWINLFNFIFVNSYLSRVKIFDEFDIRGSAKIVARVQGVRE